MGSLNLDGSIKTFANRTYRNVGGSVNQTDDETPNAKSITVNDVPSYARTAADFGTQPDFDISWYNTVSLVVVKKVTTADGDALIDRIDSKTSVAASEQPELQNKAITRRGTVNTGNRAVIRDSGDDSLVGRRDTTGAFD